MRLISVRSPLGNTSLTGIVRGTACGIASALSRMYVVFFVSPAVLRILTLFPYSGGMIAPILGGVLLMIDRSVPVYTSVVIFAFAGLCVLMLQEKPREEGKDRTIAH